jgi:hypothetical protein
MEKFFNTSEPVKQDKHYTLDYWSSSTAHQIRPKVCESRNKLCELQRVVIELKLKRGTLEKVIAD